MESQEKKPKTTAKTLPDGITQEMIDAAKAKYGAKNVRMLELSLSDDENDGYLTVLAIVPTRHIVSQYRKYIENDPKKADEILVKNSLQSHKDTVLADDGLFYGALSGLAELIPFRKASIKNC